FLKLCRWSAVQLKTFVRACLILTQALWHECLKFCRWCAVQLTACVRACLISIGALWHECLKFCRWSAVQLKTFVRACLVLTQALWHECLKFCRWSAVQLKAFAHACLILTQALWHECLKFCRRSAIQTEQFVQSCRRLVKTVLLGCIWFCLQIISLIIFIGHACLNVAKGIGRALVSLYRQFVILIKQIGRGCLIFIKKIWRGLVWVSHQIVKLIKQIAYGCLILIAIPWRTLTWIRRLFVQAGQGYLNFTRAKLPTVGERLYQYMLLVRLNKPIGIFLLLWPTLWALWIAAEGIPDTKILLVFILGVVLMRSTGCIINDLADRDLDSRVFRTQDRPIATGKVKPREALTLIIVLILCAFLLVSSLNFLTLALSLVALLLAVIYPFMKRYTYLPQVALGLAFGWAVPMAFAAQTSSVPVIAWLLLIATVLWAMVYDTMYAMVDRQDDIEIGIKSTAILFDEADRMIIGIIQCLVLCALLVIGHRSNLGYYYYVGIMAAAVFSIYQQVLIKDRIPDDCFRAFLNNNWFGAAVFAGIFVHYYLN
ncbi:MAG: 4-hydroxybenzoate octaprenyltransferase, partial [Gammaproteobacteria bacterium]